LTHTVGGTKPLLSPLHLPSSTPIDSS